jgi:poly-gamma-glutamate synthase PgsB/CapB
MKRTWLKATAAALNPPTSIFRPWRSRRSVQSIPIRIFVGGGPGKAAVTRLIAAGLCAGGLRVCAKTSGSLPRVILPRGPEYPVYRPGNATLKEQRRICQLAANQQVDALVIEGLADQTPAQMQRELQLVSPTLGVVLASRTAAGSHRAAIHGLSQSLARGGALIAADGLHVDHVDSQELSVRHPCRLVGDDEVAAVAWEELEQFSYVVYREHVALALRTCAELGVERQVAIHGMWQSAPNPGVMTVLHFQRGEQRLTFVNGFAVVDNEATGRMWDVAAGRYGHQRRVAIVNCRADRPEASRRLADVIAQWTPADHYFVIGSATRLFAQRAIALGLEPQRVTCAEQASAERLAEMLKQLSRESTLILGVGSLAGPGLQVVDHFRRLQQLSGAGAAGRPFPVSVPHAA